MLLLRGASWFFFTKAAWPSRLMLPYNYYILSFGTPIFYTDCGVPDNTQEAQP